MLVLVLMFGSLAAVAQTSRGTVTGSVTDPSGAVVPGATVVLTDKATNVSRETKTTPTGIYRFDAVNLGTYDLTIEAAGFNKVTMTGINVQANVAANLDAKLTIGTTESVTIEASSEQALQTTEQVRGRNIGTKSLTELPIGGQNSLNLMVTVPGVIPTNNGGSLDSGIGSVNGSRPRANNFMIDGVENNDISVAGPGITLTNNDAIQEVSIQTSNFSAEFGRAGGAVINQITKSGTNSLHGTLAWVYLTQKFNASSNSQRLGNPTPTAANPLKPSFKENIPAFTIGGPVMIPKMYDGRNKTFWFMAGQWDRYSTGGAQANFVVPTAAGIATLQSIATACPNVRLYLNALGGLVAPSRTSDADISIPATVLAASGSCTGTTRAGMRMEYGTATRSVPSVYLANNHQARIDHKLTDKQQLSGRWLWDESGQNNGATIGLSRDYDADFTARNMSSVIQHSWVLNNRMTNEFRFNYGRINPQFPIANPTGAGATDPTYGFGTVSGFGTSASFPQGRTANNWQYSDTISVVAGKHSVRFGGDFLRQLARQSAPVNSRGSLAYNPSTIGGVTVLGFTNFIDDFAGSSTNPISRQFGSPVYRPNLFRQSYFVQDSWKLTPTFTLNMGLRYENFGQPANFFTFPAVTFDPAQFVVPNKISADKNNFGPSFGFAWNPNPDGWFANSFWSMFHGNGKMVIRGGFQTTYDSFFNNMLSNMAAGNPNNVTNLAQVSTVSAGQPRGLSGLSARFPLLTPATLNPLSNTISQYDSKMQNPYTNRWSLGFQRELPKGIVMDVSYVGSASFKLFSNWEANPFNPNATFTGVGTRLNPAIGGRNYRDSSMNSNYNSLQVEARSRGLKTWVGDMQFSSAYTWSRNMDYVSEVFATFSNPATLSSAQRLRLTTNPKVDYGPSDNDRRHRWVTSLVWDIKGPKDGILGHAFGGWTMGYIIPIQSGTPFHVTNGNDRDWDGATADRPDVGNWNAPANSRGRTVAAATCSTGIQNMDSLACVTANDVRWLWITNFSVPNANTARRNNTWTTGQVLTNMEVLKKIRITEGLKLEYRAEIFNLTNTQNFNFVPSGTSVSTTTAAGRFLDYSRGSTGNRSMRMGLKVIF